MATITTSAGPAPSSQNYDVTVIHNGVVQPVGWFKFAIPPSFDWYRNFPVPKAFPPSTIHLDQPFALKPVTVVAAPVFGWFEGFLDPKASTPYKIHFEQPFALNPATVVAAPFGWFEGFLGPAAIKSVVHVQQPYALVPPAAAVAGGPIAEGGFATIIQRNRAIGY